MTMFKHDLRAFPVLYSILKCRLPMCLLPIKAKKMRILESYTEGEFFIAGGTKQT